MEARILELLQHPENITAGDISLLQKEVDKYPYMQSLRTLQLSAVHHFDTENYPQELTKTAAYTTDKKILYQFINQKKIEEKKEAAKLKKIVLAQDKSPVQNNEEAREVSSVMKTDDVLANQEEPKESAPFQTRAEDLNFTKETVVDQLDQKNLEETPLAAPAEISFNVFDSFLPDVKFTVPSQQNNSEDKTSTFTKDNTSEETQPVVNFYHPKTVEEPQPEVIPKEEPTPVQEEEAIVEVTKEEKPFSWKPMNWSPQPLDAQIKIEKPSTSIAVKEAAPVEVQKPIEPVQEIQEVLPKEEVKEELISKQINLSTEEIEEPKIEEKKEEISNIPNFVDTWQTWLKIDRSQVEQIKAPEKILEKKTEIIDRFIEENPKISQLKEDVQYVVKEKNDDIWHLMTETLAKLYVEQRLYSKAIKAYEVLQEKHPSRAQDFEQRIQEIKELKQNK